MQLQSNSAWTCRASVGVHAIVIVGEPETAIARADEAMYAEKYARRNEAQAFAAF